MTRTSPPKSHLWTGVESFSSIRPSYPEVNLHMTRPRMFFFFFFSFECRPGNMIAPVNIGRLAEGVGSVVCTCGVSPTASLQQYSYSSLRKRFRSRACSRLVPAAHVRVKRQAFPRSRAAPRKGQPFGVRCEMAAVHPHAARFWCHSSTPVVINNFSMPNNNYSTTVQCRMTSRSLYVCVPDPSDSAGDQSEVIAPPSRYRYCI